MVSKITTTKIEAEVIAAKDDGLYTFFEILSHFALTPGVYETNISEDTLIHRRLHSSLHRILVQNKTEIKKDDHSKSRILNSCCRFT